MEPNEGRGIRVITCGASRARIVPPPMRRGALPHTPAMRQWACVVALLLGLAGNGYVATARSRLPIAIERPLEPAMSTGPTRRTLDWWRA